MKIHNPRNGTVVVRIGGSSFTLATTGTSQAVRAKMMDQMVKITRAGGTFDYVAGYPRTGDALVACRKGQRPEQYPELMETAQ